MEGVRGVLCLFVGVRKISSAPPLGGPQKKSWTFITPTEKNSGRPGRFSEEVLLTCLLTDDISLVFLVRK